MHRFAATALALLVATPLPAFASGAGPRPSASNARTFQYACDAGRQVAVSYLRVGQDGPQFAVVDYGSHRYGLAQAISASGARYAALYGPSTSDGGLEWWEAKGEGTLSTFVGTDTTRTRAMLTGCKPAR